MNEALKRVRRAHPGRWCTARCRSTGFPSCPVSGLVLCCRRLLEERVAGNVCTAEGNNLTLLLLIYIKGLMCLY